MPTSKDAAKEVAKELTPARIAVVTKNILPYGTSMVTPHHGGVHHEDELIPRRRVPSEKGLRNIIRDIGMKVTDQRMLILKALHAGRVHVTAQEVYEIVSKQDSTIGFATVYRFLRSLTGAGFVTEVRMGGASARYELKPEGHHDHLTCVQCGKICEFENTRIEDLQEQVAKRFGFQLTGHVLELYGICPDCQRR